MDHSEQATDQRIDQVRRRIIAARQLVHARNAHLDEEAQQQVDQADRLLRQAEVEPGAADALQLLGHAEALASSAYEETAATYGQDKNSWTPWEVLQYLLTSRLFRD